MVQFLGSRPSSRVVLGYLAEFFLKIDIKIRKWKNANRLICCWLKSGEIEPVAGHHCRRPMNQKENLRPK
jgi:hypothetical protein